MIRKHETNRFSHLSLSIKRAKVRQISVYYKFYQHFSLNINVHIAKQRNYAVDNSNNIIGSQMFMYILFLWSFGLITQIYSRAFSANKSADFRRQLKYAK